jgi:hypothetical protein
MKGIGLKCVIRRLVKGETDSILNDSGFDCRRYTDSAA